MNHCFTNFRWVRCAALKLIRLSNYIKSFHMRKTLTLLLCCFMLTQSFGQSQRETSTYLWGQYNQTLYDYTLGNNPWGIGFGLQTFFINKTKFRPIIELTGDLYLMDDKVFRLNPDGSYPETENTVRGMVNLFVGSSFDLNRNVYLSLVAGPSFIQGRTYLGVKPSFGFYFSKNQRWTGKVSYINIFNRTKMIKQDFGSLSFALGIRIF